METQEAESIVIDGVQFFKADTLSSLDELNNYLSHLTNRHKSLTDRRKIINTLEIGRETEIDEELSHVYRLHNAYRLRYNYIRDESKKEKKKIREQQRRKEQKIKKEKETKEHNLCVDDKEKRMVQQAIIQDELDELHATLAEKQCIRDQRLQEIEQELGIDADTSLIKVLQKKHDKLNKGKLKCPHFHKTTSKNPDRPHWDITLKYSHLITCDTCGKTWIDEDYVCM